MDASLQLPRPTPQKPGGYRASPDHREDTPPTWTCHSDPFPKWAKTLPFEQHREQGEALQLFQNDAWAASVTWVTVPANPVVLRVSLAHGNAVWSFYQVLIGKSQCIPLWFYSPLGKTAFGMLLDLNRDNVWPWSIRMPYDLRFPSWTRCCLNHCTLNLGLYFNINHQIRVKYTKLSLSTS